MKKLILLIFIQSLFPCASLAMNVSHLLRTTTASSQATKKLKEYNNKNFFNAADASQKLKALLEYKPDVNIHNKKDHGYTPLMYAIEAKKVPLVTMLLDAGANIKEKNSSTELYSQTVAELAARYATPDILDLLVAHGLNIQDEGGRILFIASVASNADLVSYLLTKYKINPNFISKDILPPQFGSYYDQTPLLAIIKRTRTTGTHGWRPTQEEKDIIKALLDAGADPFLSTFDGNDAYYIATHYGKFGNLQEIVNLLYANNKVKAKLADEELSRIHWHERSVNEVKRWLQDGGNPNIKTINYPNTESSLTPLDRMALATKLDIAKELISAGANLDNALVNIYSNSKDMGEDRKEPAMRFLLRLGANPDVRLANGDTLLMDAISKDTLHFPAIAKVKLLLEFGANTHLINNGNSAFDVARRINRNDILKILSEERLKKIS